MANTYSAVIRSTGDTPFLARVLGSLRSQSVPPSEIVISIPRDVEPWAVSTPGVRFVQSDRGMVSQRAQGIRSARNDHVLIVDDDVILERTGAARLIEALEGGAHCVLPYSLVGSPAGVKRWICALFGIAVPRRAGGVRYTAGGGYYYPVTPPPTEGWETAGGVGMVIAANRKFAMEHQALGDGELERMFRYPVREDAAFVLLVARAGGKCLMVPGADYVDLGTERHLAPGSLRERYMAQVGCHYEFWRKYIRPDYANTFRRRTWAQLSLAWYIAGSCTLAAAAAVRFRNIDTLRGAIQGIRATRHTPLPGRSGAPASPDGGSTR